ncbi:MAG: 4-(cytidine 5'-diphospho)-2-C-methyl-D-erythritol kinase [Muribaculaceae bacterium]|nr:4-(cytidine 5'-diphospho)-2-C-methyl-D-erythritol kinase [Muribaculaceae bacterium]
MVSFVNAKINIGLNVVAKRPDGYHNLQTVFYPVGIESGLPHQPEPFDDVMEVKVDYGKVSGCRFQFMGRKIECEPRKNLVVRAATLFLGSYNDRFGDLADYGMFEITLDKHLPEGAGMGGGSADASFTLKMLNEVTGNKFDIDELSVMAQKLGADCPFFLLNKPAYATGTGENLTPINLELKGLHLLIVKPDLHISTAEAFAGIKPHEPEFDLQFLPYLPVEEWKSKVFNDFETTLFDKYPLLAEIKHRLYDAGAIYASMTGSGSALYGFYVDMEAALKERETLLSTYRGVWLFGL